MTAPPSLLRRIVLRLSLTTLAAILCAYGWLWVEFKSTTGNLRDKSLIETARRLADAVKDTDGRLSFDLPPSLMQAYGDSNGAHGFAVRDRETGRTLYSAGADPGPIPAKVEDDEDGSLYQYNADGPGPATYFGEALPFRVAGRSLIVQVVRLGSDYQELIETVLADFFEDGGWLGVPFLLALLLVSILTVRGTLKPLERVSSMAESIGPQSTERRLPDEGVPREVLPLVRAVNHALDRLEEGFRRQRDFTADAAHELRTPLAVLTAHIDILPDRATAAALRRDLDSMTHLVEQLLRVAQAEALVVGTADNADLSELAREVAAWLGPMAIRSGRMIEVEAPEAPVMVRGQADALFHAIRNLAENALRHTPADTTVTLTVDADPPRLTVRDEGPGVPPAMRKQIFQRFWRADRRTSGTGLGLAIVQRTIQAHGGEVVISGAQDGGAEFTLIFPGASKVSVS